MIRRILASKIVPLTLFSYSSYQLFLKPAFNAGGGFYSHFVRSRVDFKQRYGQNSYAIVTGATSGIGAQFADQLAKEGFNLVLIGRSAEKLKAKREELQNKYPNHKIETRQLNLSSQNLDDYQELAKSVDSLDIAILVNNAGVFSVKPFLEQDPANLQNIVNSNMGHYVYMTNLLLPKMKQREKKSAILFTSSIAAGSVTPYMTTYAGTKTFNYIFSQRLKKEVKDNIDVMSFNPHFVSSNMVKAKPNGSTVLSSEQAAGRALDKLGHETWTTGSWKHKVNTTIIMKCLSMIPEDKRYGMIRDSMKQLSQQ